MGEVCLSKSQRGFTLIELIVVIVIAGIILISVATRLLGTSEFSAHTTRDVLIGELRVAQLRALNDHSVCYSVQISSSDIGIYQAPISSGSCSSSFTLTNRKTTLESDVAISVGGVLNTSATRQILFDNKGRSSGGSCVSGSRCTLNVIGNTTLSLCIESEGFVHGC